MARITGAHMIVPAVKMTFEADELCGPRMGAGEAQRQQRGLGPGCGEAHPHRAGHQRLDQPGPGDFFGMACAEMGAGAQLRLGGLGHIGVPVAQNKCPVTDEIIHVFVAVHVPFAGALGPLHIERMRILVADIVADAARKPAQGFGVKPGRARRPLPIGGFEAAGPDGCCLIRHGDSLIYISASSPAPGESRDETSDYQPQHDGGIDR